MDVLGSNPSPESQPSQTQWPSPRTMATRASPIHRRAPFLGQPDVPGHTLYSGPSCAAVGTHRQITHHSTGITEAGARLCEAPQAAGRWQEANLSSHVPRGLAGEGIGNRGQQEKAEFALFLASMLTSDSSETQEGFCATWRQ